MAIRGTGRRCSRRWGRSSRTRPHCRCSSREVATWCAGPAAPSTSASTAVRSRPTGCPSAGCTGPQATLWPDWRHHSFVTNRQGNAVELDADHRRHAVCELAIRDLKDGAGLRHCPSSSFLANAAWLVLATLAHNLLRWVASVGLGSRGQVVAKTIRRRLLAMPGRLTRSARRRLLHLPSDWPWARQFLGALARLQAVPLRA
jgi:Transposase DDE domain group 1